jgi:hypothetical protein
LKFGTRELIRNRNIKGGVYMANSTDQLNEIPCWNKKCSWFDHNAVLNCKSDDFKVCKIYKHRKTMREIQLEAQLKDIKEIANGLNPK